MSPAIDFREDLHSKSSEKQPEVFGKSKKPDFTVALSMLYQDTARNNESLDRQTWANVLNTLWWPVHPLCPIAVSRLRPPILSRRNLVHA